MKKLLVLTTLCSLLLAGSSERLQINLDTDENGNTNPNIFIPIYWTDSIFSGIGYSSNNSYDVNKLDDYPNSRIGTVIDEQRLILNILTYEIKSDSLTYGIGAEIEKIYIDKQEFGYFELDNDIIATENSIEIEILQPNIVADVSYKNSEMFIRLGTKISPANTLDVEQTTILQPLLTTPLTSNSSTSQDIAYDINFKAGYKLSSLFSIIAQSKYSVLPIKYNLSLAGTGTETIEIEETTTSSMLKLAFNLDSFSSELSPSIGFGKESISTKDISSNETDTLSNNLFMIGFEGRF